MNIELNKNVNPHEEIQNRVRNAILNIAPSVNESVLNRFYLSLPPQHIKADYALSTFFLKEETNQDAGSIANRIVEHFSKERVPLVKRISAIGPYVNIEVNKSMYYEMAINHIFSKKSLFGSLKKENPQTIYINYMGGDMHTQLVGQVIGRHYEKMGHTVIQNEFNPNDEQLISIGREVTNDALKYKVAEYVSDTNVVMTLPTKHSSSIILQRNDRSLTRDALYLALTRELIQKEKPSKLIYVTPLDQSQTVESLVSNARLMKYIGPEIKTSNVVVNRSDLRQYVSNKGLAAKYAILRVPIDKKVPLNKEQLLVYSSLENIILKLDQKSQQSNKTDFDFAKLLITFPDVVVRVTDSHRPDALCVYLEKVAELCDKRSVHKNEKLSSAASIVLKNGLQLLFS